MPRTIDRDDGWEEDGDNSDWTPDDDAFEVWHEDENGDDTMPCPHCGQPVYEDAEQCPSCRTFISKEDAPRHVKPWWIVVGGLICLAVVVLWIWR